MITWANLRASAAPWLALPALLFVWLYVDRSTVVAASGYGVESGEITGYALASIAPAVAGAAAWEAHRHRAVGALQETGARGRVRQRLRAAVPVLLLHLVLAVAALVLARGVTGVWPSGAGWLGVTHLLVLPLGWLVIGWSLGLTLPKSIAAPLAAIGCWGWLCVPRSMKTPWVRHLGGLVDATSSVTDLRQPSVYAVPWLVVAGFALAAGALAGVRRRVWLAAVALLVATATLFTGRALVHDWGYQSPSRPREATLSCTGEAPAVCVPPEYRRYAARLRAQALAPLDRLAAAGIPAPRELRISSKKFPVEAGTWPLYWGPRPAGAGGEFDGFAQELGESAVAATGPRGRPDCHTWWSTAAVWAALVAGQNEQSVRRSVPDVQWAQIEKVRALPRAAQADWFRAAAAAQHHSPCRAGELA